jgi:hypothetical protein
LPLDSVIFRFMMLYMTAKLQPKILPAFSIRWDEEESKVITALRKKLGVRAIAELIRMALKALAEKNGIEV